MAYLKDRTGQIQRALSTDKNHQPYGALTGPLEANSTRTPPLILTLILTLTRGESFGWYLASVPGLRDRGQSSNLNPNPLTSTLTLTLTL